MGSGREGRAGADGGGVEAEPLSDMIQAVWGPSGRVAVDDIPHFSHGRAGRMWGGHLLSRARPPA